MAPQDQVAVSVIPPLSDFALSQVLIGFALFFNLASFQFRSKRYTLACLTVAVSLIAAHFFLLQVYTAAALAVIAALRFLSAIFWQSKWLMFLFLAMIATSAVLTWAGLLTVLVSVATTISTIGAFRGSDRAFRLVMMAAASIMVAHNILAQSPAAVALELVFLGSNLVGYYRYYIRRKVRQEV